MFQVQYNFTAELGECACITRWGVTATLAFFCSVDADRRKALSFVALQTDFFRFTFQTEFLSSIPLFLADVNIFHTFRNESEKFGLHWKLGEICS